MKRELVASALAMSLVGLMGLAVTALAADGAATGKLVFQIGQFDNDDAEFANAPEVYNAYLDSFPDDCYYIVGTSSPAKDWNYIHPGLVDGWADGKAHTWTVEFKSDAVPAGGQAVLTLDLVGAHEIAPPELTIELNGKEVGKIATDPGTGSEYSTAAGQPGQVKVLSFDAKLIRAGKNTLTIANDAEGKSWVVYDALSLSIM